MCDAIVSIIVPCYNVANTLSRFLDSVMEQTYQNIQVIAVNDGSTDDTESILKKYQQFFLQKGMVFDYIYQDNQGLGAAINTGLKYIKGDYLCWADPDDFFVETSIQERIEILENNDEYDIVSSDAYYYKFNDLNNPVQRATDGLIHKDDPNQFEYLLFEQSHFCPGCHMLRMSAFDKVNPNREIFPAKRGQNWQLLLPMYYKYHRYYLDKPLYNYILYPNSMSRGDSDLVSVVLRLNEHETILVETINKIDMEIDEKKKYLNLVKIRYAKKRFYAAIDFRNKRALKKSFLELKSLSALNSDICRLYLRNKFMIFKVIFKSIDKVKKVKRSNL